MKLIKTLLRKAGYEISKVPPPPSAPVLKFLNGREGRFEPKAADDASVPVESSFSPSLLSGPPRELIVEGWRLLPHSYAIVNQWQLLSLSRRPDVRIKVRDALAYRLDWSQQEGLFEPDEEQLLKSLAIADSGQKADLVLRMSFPLDFVPSQSRRTAVFGTMEEQTVHKALCADFRIYDQLRRGIAPPPEVTAVTPSRWSAEGFYKAGFRPEQVLVVPHGVDAGTFRPLPQLRERVRGAMSLRDDDFVFLNVSAMTLNKGIDLLLQAFAEVSRKYPRVRLILKGMDPLYSSGERLLRLMRQMPPADQERVASRTLYYGSSLSNKKMALLYQAADAYVSPYASEAFNIPVLEAAACGLPVICTDGGPTDDFVTETFGRKIQSSRVSTSLRGQVHVSLKPDVRHLVSLMTAMIEDDSWRKAAAVAGPAHVRANYSWDHVVDRLVRGLLA